MSIFTSRSSNFNLTQYQGKWYEVGKYPVKYEPVDCKFSTAEYRYNEQGNYLNVMNTCFYNENSTLSILGKAEPTAFPGILLLKFFPESFQPFPIPDIKQPYSVLWTDYHNFSFIGDEISYYILSRRPNITRSEFNFIINKTRELGYDTSKVKFNNLPGSHS